MLQLVSLIKQGDVDRSGARVDAEPNRPAEPTGLILITPAAPVGLAGPGGPAAPVGPAGAAGRVGRVGGVVSVPPGEEDRSDAGMSTVEYAVGTVAAAAFAAVLYQIVTAGSVLAGLTELINRAMSLF